MVDRSVFLNLSFFLVIGLAGYFSTFDATSKIVIEREPLIGTAYDYFMIVGQAMISIVLCIAYPMNLVPIKRIIVH